MMKPRAFVVSVEFGDVLRITLERNAKHFSEIIVISSFSDEETMRVAYGVKNASLYQTNEFYLNGASFNKWAALESALDSAGREGWICVMDADILIPEYADLSGASAGKLWTPRRRILADLSRWPVFVHPNADWDELPLNRDEEWAGYFQLFHAGDQALIGRKHWYDPTFKHAGGSDSFFAEYWPRHRRARPPFEVLHLGEDGKNWCGRCTPRVDGSTHPQATARAAELQRFLTLREKNGNMRAEKLQQHF